MMFLGFIIGIIVGSFTKAVADRKSKEISIKGRSYCPNCKHNLQWYDLFPVLSFLFLKGRCRYCKEKIGIDYLLVEVFSGIIVAAIFATTLPPDFLLSISFDFKTVTLLLELIFKIFLVGVLVIIALIDLQTGLIPNRITYPATIIAIIYLLVSSTVKSYWFYQNLLQSTFGPYLLPPRSGYLYDHLLRIWQPAWAAGLAGFLAAAVFILLIVVTRGRGMGWGDVKFVFFLGLALGFPNIIVSIFLAFFSGAVFSLMLIALRKKHFGQTIPFGPFLSLGAVITLIWGTWIINWYINSFRM